jgi:hypothetical protein
MMAVNTLKWLGLSTTLLLLAACQNIPGSGNLSDDDVTDLKDVFVRESEASAVGMSLSETVLTVGFSAPTPRVQSVNTLEPDPSNTSLYTQALPSGCRSIVAGSDADTDGDGVPNDVTFQFDAIKCTRTYIIFPNITRTLSGQVRLEDANPSVKDGSYRETSSDFRFSEEFKGDPSFSETRNGTRSLVTLAGQSLTRENNMTTSLERRFLADLRIVNQMRFAFTASSGTVAINAPLPAGSFEISGGVQSSRGNAPLQLFSVTTEQPVQYDPNCDFQRLTGGAVILRSNRGAVRLEFRACGSPAIATRVP